MERKMETIEKLLKVARGTEEGDLILKNGILFNTLSGEVYSSDVIISCGMIAGIGSYENASKVIDLKGKFLVPGLIDGHVHVESSMLSPGEFARALVGRGVTSAVIDPHELANVVGKSAISFFLREALQVPMNFFVMVPSCVPATGDETAGAEIRASDYREILKDPRVLGLAEMMNFPGVISGDRQILEKLLAAGGKPVDGHAPKLTGKDLCAYIAAGVTSEHECMTAIEALEKLRLGMYIMLREGSATKNLLDLLPLVNKFNSNRCFLATDDLHPDEILEHGQIDHLVRMIIHETGNPMRAIRMATINAAEYYGLRQIGAIAPGRIADLIVVGDMDRFEIRTVIKSGQIAFDDGTYYCKRHDSEEYYRRNYPELLSTMAISGIKPQALKVPVRGKKIRVIEILPEQIVTGMLIETPEVRNREAVASPSRDLLKLAVIERHRGTGNVGIGFVRGFGFSRGAIASSVAHDSHNIIVAGTNDEDMAAACACVAAAGGGIAAVDGKTREIIPLPLGGLMSFSGIEEVAEGMKKMKSLVRSWGGTLDDPFMQLSFLALPVIPELKLTDRGLVQSGMPGNISLWMENE
ncbi:MAG: adenine deaminase [Candidatus Wallbacteria bacterium]|nr:adenine deaminase [Candidatus Wallbacteria bacterium]